MPTCFFIGHREAPDSLRPQLSTAVKRHIIEFGVTDFVVGGYGWLDAMAARIVKTAKKTHPMETVPKRAAIVKANRYMVDHSDYLISYTWHPVSNARELVDYAKRREKRGLI